MDLVRRQDQERPSVWRRFNRDHRLHQTLEREKRSKLETTDAFITNPTRDMKGYGSWWIEKKEGDDGEGVLRIKGDGRFAGGAVEDDDLLYNGSGPKEDITFAVSIAKLRADFKHTNLKE